MHTKTWYCERSSPVDRWSVPQGFIHANLVQLRLFRVLPPCIPQPTLWGNKEIPKRLNKSNPFMGQVPWYRSCRLPPTSPTSRNHRGVHSCRACEALTLQVAQIRLLVPSGTKRLSLSQCAKSPFLPKGPWFSSWFPFKSHKNGCHLKGRTTHISQSSLGTHPAQVVRQLRHL